jgi:hypothetical protein
MTREPTELEQYYLELVNRARANPNAEVDRLSGLVWGDEGDRKTPDLNEGLAPGTILAAPKQPLAFDPRLIDAASDYSGLLLLTEQFSHTADGTSLSRMVAAGYVFSPPSRAGENLATTASRLLHLIGPERVNKHHEGLFIDGDVAGRGHRINLLQDGFREVGIAMLADTDGISIFGPGFNEVLSTQNFASSNGRIFVTGVIYHDFNLNLFYDPGETAGILPLTVKTTGGALVASGTSFISGGYSINLNGVPPGDYMLSARDPLGNEETAVFSWGGTRNVKIDLVDPEFPGPPVIDIPFRPDGCIGANSTSFTGNELFDPTGMKQSVSLTARSPKSLSWHARFENDGSSQDNFIIDGTVGSRLFDVTYLRRRGSTTSANVTAAVLTGLQDTVQSGSSMSFEILVKPRTRALGRRNGISFRLGATSSGDRTKVDRLTGVLENRTKKARRTRR